MVPSSRISLYIREDLNYDIGNLSSRLRLRQRNLDSSLLHELYLHIREDLNHNIGNLSSRLRLRQRNLDGSLLHEFFFTIPSCRSISGTIQSHKSLMTAVRRKLKAKSQKPK